MSQPTAVATSTPCIIPPWRYRIRVGEEEDVGATTLDEIRAESPCPACKGTGLQPSSLDGLVRSVKCVTCRGSGVVTVEYREYYRESVGPTTPR